MSSINLIILGILKQEPQGAYDIQKAVEYRNLSKWVKFSTPSIYKNVLQLEKKGLISGQVEKKGNMPEKVIYSLTKMGEKYFEELMMTLSEKSVSIFFDFNAVIANLDYVALEKQEQCLTSICKKINEFRIDLEKMVEVKKHIPQNGRSVLQQQMFLAETLEQWAEELKNNNTGK